MGKTIFKVNFLLYNYAHLMILVSRVAGREGSYDLIVPLLAKQLKSKTLALELLFLHHTYTLP